MLSETSQASSISDVNVNWRKNWKGKIKERSLSIYDDGSLVELPTSASGLGDFLECFYALQDDVKGLRESHPERSREWAAVAELVEVCLEDCVVDEGFDFFVAYSSIKNIIEALSEGLVKQKGEGLKKAFSWLSGTHTCDYCGSPLPRYPGVQWNQCPNCGQSVRIIYDKMAEGLVPPKRRKRYREAKELEPHLITIREEIKKRSALHARLTKMTEGSLDRLDALKAAMSCMTRVIVQEQHHPELGVLESIGEPLLVDIISLFLNENSGRVQARIGKYFGKADKAMLPEGSYICPKCGAKGTGEGKSPKCPKCQAKMSTDITYQHSVGMK